MKEIVQPVAPTGTQIRVNFVHCDNTVLFDAFDLGANTRYSFLHNSYAGACAHAESLGLTNAQMRNAQVDETSPYFSFDWWILQPRKTFKDFYQTRIGPYQ